MAGRFWPGTAPYLFSTDWAPAFGAGSSSATPAATKALSDTAWNGCVGKLEKLHAKRINIWFIHLSPGS